MLQYISSNHNIKLHITKSGSEFQFLKIGYNDPFTVRFSLLS